MRGLGSTASASGSMAATRARGAERERRVEGGG